MLKKRKITLKFKINYMEVFKFILKINYRPFEKQSCKAQKYCLNLMEFVVAQCRSVQQSESELGKQQAEKAINFNLGN